MNAEQLLRHFERISEAPDAIPRLRRFILDLAVRGKLVEQDPRDEPAAELLKRIAEEKARLGTKSTVRSLDQDEIPFELPSGWSWSRIGEVCSKTGSGSTPRGGKDVYKKSGVIFLRSQNIYNDGLRLNDVVYIDEATHERMSGTRVVPDDLLLNITGGSMGRCCLVSGEAAEANVSQHVAILRAAFKGIERFLHKLVLSPYFQAYVFAEQTGAGRGGLPKNRMDKIAVAMPPLAEQHRIVARVDELMSLCDQLEAAKAEREECRDSLVAASLQRLNQPAEEEETFREHAHFTFNNLQRITTRAVHIKQLRQTVLNLAVRGKLVSQDPSDEPVVMRYQNELGGEDIPETWRVLNFGKFCKIEGGNQPPKSMFIDEPRNGYIRLFQIRDLGDRPVPVYIPVASARSLCKEGEILIGRYGASVGKIFWAQNGAYNVAMAKFVWPDDAFIRQFAFLLLKSDYLQGPLNKATRSAQAGFNKSDLAPINFPLPPFAEQHRIVARVDELMRLCDQLEEQLIATERDSLRFLEAVLNEALSPALASAD